MARYLAFILVPALTLCGGCQSFCRRSAPCPPAGAQVRPQLPPGVSIPPPPAPVAVPAAPCPTPGAAAIVPGSIPPPPPAGAAPPPPPPPGATIPPPAPTPSNLGPPASANTPPPMPPAVAAPVESRWQPVEAPASPPRVQLAVPEALPDSNKPSESKSAPPSTPEPPLLRSKSPTSLPVGIPQFAPVREGVATGLRPSLDDGLDWLQTNGYRTVLHLRAPGEDDGADRKQVEKRGLTYLSLEVAPDTWNAARADEFLSTVRSATRQPLFVYDRDGSMIGPLWYLYFRSAENMPQDAARLRARALGLREDASPQAQALWLAVRKTLGDNTP